MDRKRISDADLDAFKGNEAQPDHLVEGGNDCIELAPGSSAFLDGFEDWQGCRYAGRREPAS